MHWQRVAGHAGHRAERLAFDVTAHREFAAGNPHHPFGRGTGCGDRIGYGWRESRGARRRTGLGGGDRCRPSVAGSQRFHGQDSPRRNHHEPEDEPATTNLRRRPDGDSTRFLFSFHRRLVTSESGVTGIVHHPAGGVNREDRAAESRRLASSAVPNRHGQGPIAPVARAAMVMIADTANAYGIVRRW